MSLYRLHDRKRSSSCRFAPVCPRTAVSTVTTCSRATFDTIKYAPAHMQVRPHMHALPPVRS
eukprot:142138-Prymnesium_polylepis.1